MSAYAPPVYWFNGIGFDSGYFTTASSSSGLTQAQANLLYLQKTIADTDPYLATFSNGVIASSIKTGLLDATSSTGNLYIGQSSNSGNLQLGTGLTTGFLQMGSGTSTTILNGVSVQLGGTTSTVTITPLGFAQVMNFVGWGTRALSITGQRMLYPTGAPQIFYFKAGYKQVNLSLSHYITAGNGGVFPMYVSMYVCANATTLPSSATLDSFVANWTISQSYVVSTLATFQNVSFSFITDYMADGYYYFDIKWQNPNVTDANSQGFANMTVLNIPSTSLVSGIRSTSGGP